MNIKLISLTAALAFTSAMAQNYAGNPAETVNQAPAGQAVAPAPVEDSAQVQAPAPAPAPTPAPAPQAQAAPTDTASNSPFDVLRGNAYNPIENQAAASTVNDNLASPYKMAGAKFVYLEPTDDFAAVAFGTDLTKFLVFTNHENLGIITAGIAKKSFGFAVDFAFAKDLVLSETTTAYDKTSTTSRTVGKGDIIRLTFAAPLGALDFTASGYWETFDTEKNISTEYKDFDSKSESEEDNDFWDLGVNAGISNTPSGKDMFWSLNLALKRHENYTETSVNKNESEVTHPDAYIYIQPSFNIGLSVLQSSNARVLLGLNTRLPIVFYDEIKDENSGNKDNYHSLGIFTSPNILAELALSECWMIFGGAKFDWTVFSMNQGEFISDYDDEYDMTKVEYTLISSKTNVTTVTAGARFQYKNFALEAGIEDSFYNNPFEGFNGNEFIGHVGGFIYF